MKKAVSLKDIAREVGVSPSSVSYILNGRGKEKRLSDQVAEKVLKAAEKYNYVPNQIAKSLKTKKSHTIGFIVGEIFFRYTTGVTRSIEARAKEHGFTVIIGNSHEELVTLRELIDVFINRQVDGLIIIAAEKAEAEIDYLKKREIPFVLIDRNYVKVQANFIGIDNYKVAYDGTNYLLQQGFKNIAFVNYFTTFQHLHERDRGYKEALQKAQFKFTNQLHRQLRKDSLDKDMQKAIVELTNGDVKCDAIYFATDTLAIQGLKRMVELKVEVPEKVAVLSFDEAEAFALFNCPVTYFRQPLEAIGIAAVDLLFKAIKNPKTITEVCLESKFIMGKSCGEK